MATPSGTIEPGAQFSISAGAASVLGRCAAFASMLNHAPVECPDIVLEVARTLRDGERWRAAVDAPERYCGEGKTAETALLDLEVLLRARLRDR